MATSVHTPPLIPSTALRSSRMHELKSSKHHAPSSLSIAAALRCRRPCRPAASSSGGCIRPARSSALGAGLLVSDPSPRGPRIPRGGVAKTWPVPGSPGCLSDGAGASLRRRHPASSSQLQPSTTADRSEVQKAIFGRRSIRVQAAPCASDSRRFSEGEVVAALSLETPASAVGQAGWRQTPLPCGIRFEAAWWLSGCCSTGGSTAPPGRAQIRP